eukprot:CAMPEP_0197623968 /NCGR_PEP_ID=MMETSP1338-20131121/3817_1 /TAXON_ID=43686 ORGANISM="Pelagodinium beii, Strain RCC1491" /NCGR_SAMPLE_ID=MMETSP1338 /ASSEMBLY_ACC=CAM_ASM_000754 /LENGTH=706 /DNA_ID=CAMNT_0043194063 /DNA_START=182 /DNA_END=2302 /DNA_ORIENTATION=+
MTYDQLGSCYSIKNGQSVTQRLKEISSHSRPMLLGDFVSQMGDYFETVGKNQVKARPSISGEREVLSSDEQAPIVSRSGGYPAHAGSLPDSGAPSGPVLTMRYSDVSRNIQGILKDCSAPIPVSKLDALFLQRYSTSVSDVVGMSTFEYLQRKENIFDYNSNNESVSLKSSMMAGPPTADSGSVKDETFVVKEFAQLIEALGPVVYISTLCGKFIQRNGTSVTSVISTRPLDLFKRHHDTFLIVGSGNVTLKKYELLPEVQKLMDKPSCKAYRVAKAAEEASLPIPTIVTEQHVVEEFRRLILMDGIESVYISSLCGRFLQRFKKPVTGIINCKPAEFLRRYPEIFVMTGGGNVGLREVLGADAVSVPPPPPRPVRANKEMSLEMVQQMELSDQDFREIYEELASDARSQALQQQLSAVCAKIEKASFLALEEVVLGGAAGKGLCVVGREVEIVLYVRQLPCKNFPQWLPHILETLAPVMEFQLAALRAVDFKVEPDHLCFQLQNDLEPDNVPVRVYLTPVFNNQQHLFECIQASPPAERVYFYPALVKERNAFVDQRSQETKVLIHLMWWWVTKQTWAGALSRPSDWLVELLVIHTSLQLDEDQQQAFDLSEMVTNVMQNLAAFNSLKVHWADIAEATYSLEDISTSLLSQELLFMDPVNAFSNMADVNSFNPFKMTSLAQAPACLYAFKCELSKLGQDDDETDA